MPSVAVTVITNSKGLACKTFELIDGKLVKKSAAQIYEGEARRVEVAGLAGLLRLINGLRSDQALTYGVPAGGIERAAIVTQKQKRLNGSAAICRDRRHFCFAEGRPGVWMFDHDPQPGQKPKTAREIDAILCEVMPELAAVQRAWKPSSSAHIYRAGDDETPLIGMGGWRGYAIVNDASTIPMLGAELYRRLWAAGHGYIQPSKSSALLDRTLIDASVWQPERLDFAAAPVLGEGLTQDRPRGLILPGETTA